MKIRVLLKEQGREDFPAVEPKSSKEQEMASVKEVREIFAKYGYEPEDAVNPISKGQFSRVYKLFDKDGKLVIGKLSQSSQEYVPYERAKQIKLDLESNTEGIQHAKHLPVVYVAEATNKPIYKSVIIMENLEPLDPTLKQYIYGGIGDRYDETIPDIRFRALIKLMTVPEEIKTVIEDAINRNAKQKFEYENKQYPFNIDYNTFYNSLIKIVNNGQVNLNALDMEDLQLTSEYIGRRESITPSINALKEVIESFSSNSTPKSQQYSIAFRTLLLVYAHIFKLLLINKIHDVNNEIDVNNDFGIRLDLINVIKSFYASLYNNLTLQPMSTSYEIEPSKAGTIASELVPKSFMSALKYIKDKYNFGFVDLHSANIMMRPKDRAIVVSDLGKFRPVTPIKESKNANFKIKIKRNR